MQNKPLSIGQRIAILNEIREAIKYISDANGSDEPEFLERYTDEVLEVWKEELETALVCFRELKAQAKYLHR